MDIRYGDMARQRRDAYALEVAADDAEKLRAEVARLTAEVKRFGESTCAADGTECTYCHGVGACPRCWGRSGIEKMTAEVATIRALLGRAADAMEWNDQCPRDEAELAALITACRDAAEGASVPDPAPALAAADALAESLPPVLNMARGHLAYMRDFCGHEIPKWLPAAEAALAAFLAARQKGA